MTPYERTTIRRAVRILEKHATYTDGNPLTSPEAAKQLAFLRLANEPNEVFACAFLNNRHGLIAFERLFFGTIDGASVHPRVVVQKGLEHNAAAVVFAHNHPLC
jgi:DNA repair protein RadC